jgi:hypothetical protein
MPCQRALRPESIDCTVNSFAPVGLRVRNTLRSVFMFIVLFRG